MIKESLAEPLPFDCSTLPTIELQEDARAMIGEAFERMETAARQGSLQVIKPFALRATEQTCRVAGVLTAFDGRDSINAADAHNALDLVRYSIATWRAVIDEGAADPTGADAMRLYQWLTDPKHCPGWEAQGKRILNGGPACVRSKDKRDAALDMLVAAGLAERGDKGMVFALHPTETGDVEGDHGAG